MAHTLVVYGKRLITTYGLEVGSTAFLSLTGRYEINVVAKEKSLEDGIIFEDHKSTISLGVEDQIVVSGIDREIKVLKVRKDLSNNIIEAYTDYVIHNFIDHGSKKKSEEDKKNY